MIDIVLKRVPQYLICFFAFILLVSCTPSINNETPDISHDEVHSEETISIETYKTLAEEYELNRLMDVQEQFEKIKATLYPTSLEILPQITSAQIKKLDFAVEYKGYQIFYYKVCYFTETSDTSLPLVGGWELTEDGGYLDNEPQYIVFSNDTSPEVVGVMMCEFTPSGNLSIFYDDVYKFIAEQNLEK